MNSLFVRCAVAVLLSSLIGAASVQAQIGWTINRVNGDADLVAVYFTSEEKGWIAGDSGYLAYTADAGRTWNKYPLKATEDINEIYFRNEENGYLVAGRKMFITRDGGASWQETHILQPGVVRNGTPEFLSIRFADRKRGLAIGSVLDRREMVIDSIVMRTEDGGETWRRIIVPSKKELYHLDFNGSSHAWIVGDEGLVLASDDSGMTWKAQSSGVRVPLFNVDFRDDNDGFAVGKGGTILRTENGGLSWERVNTGYPETLMRVNFADDKNGWIVGHGGVILRSSDRGRTWLRQSSKTGERIYGLFMSKKFGWAVGAKGLILQYLR
jgi:photosystem II stability/assembly factor-like uncharacterized protein